MTPMKKRTRIIYGKIQRLSFGLAFILLISGCTSYSEVEKLEIETRGNQAIDDIEATVDTIDGIIANFDSPKDFDGIVARGQLKGEKIFLLNVKDKIEGELEDKDFSGINEEVEMWERARQMVSDSIKSFNSRYPN